MASVKKAAERDKLLQGVFDEILDILRDLQLYNNSTKFFVIYAHDGLDSSLEKHQAEVKNYISWFKDILFHVDSDRSPHGYGPLVSVGHRGADRNIIINQYCLLPLGWHDANVDEVLLFYSDQMAEYMHCAYDEFATELVTALDAYRGSTLESMQWEQVKKVVSKVQEKHESIMGPDFHNVMTELALLKFRLSRLPTGESPDADELPTEAQRAAIIPVDLDSDNYSQAPQDAKVKEKKIRQDGRKKNFLGLNISKNHLYNEVDTGKEHELFFKILLQFEFLNKERPILESLRNCYGQLKNLLSGWATGATSFKLRAERELLKVIKADRRISSLLLRSERQITTEYIRIQLDRHARRYFEDVRLMSGALSATNMLEIDIAVHKENTVGEEAKSELPHIIPTHAMFDEIVVADKRLLPRRIMIQGQPGIGKTTLSKQLMHKYCLDEKLGRVFELVVRLPARLLLRCLDLQEALYEEYFRYHPRGRKISEELQNRIQNNSETTKANILLIIDGLDEAKPLSEQKQHGSWLTSLTSKCAMIMTSRFSLKEFPADLRLEALGLSDESVNEYLAYLSAMDSHNTAQIKEFINTHSFVRDMVKLPICLNILCRGWPEIQMHNSPLEKTEGKLSPRPPTVTELYQAVVRALWRQDVPNLGKFDHDEPVTLEVVESLGDTTRLERLVSAEITLLEKLASSMVSLDKSDFTGNEVQAAIRAYEADGNQFPLSIEKNLPRLSVIHSFSEKGLWGFAHLTFQYFFLALSLARHPHKLKTHLKIREDTHRFGVITRFISGLVSTKEQADHFFTLLQEMLPESNVEYFTVFLHCFRECKHTLDDSHWKDFYTRFKQHSERFSNTFLAVELEKSAQTHLIELFREKLGSTDPDTLDVMQKLGLAKTKLGQIREANLLLRKRLEALETSSIVDLASQIRAAADLTAVYELQGRFKDAEELQEDMLQKCEAAGLSEDDPILLDTKARLASAYMSQGQWPKAEEKQLEVFSSRREKLGRHHPDTIQISTELAWSYKNQKKYKQALPLLRHAMGATTSTSAQGQLDEKYMSAAFKWISTLAASGKVEMAVIVLESLLETLTMDYGAEHPLTLEAKFSLGKLYGLRRAEDTVGLRDQEMLYLAARDGFRRIFGWEHPKVLEITDSLATLYFDNHKDGVGVAELEEVVRIRIKIQGANHPATLHSISELNAARATLGPPPFY